MRYVWKLLKYLCVKQQFSPLKTSIYPRKYANGMHLLVLKVWFSLRTIWCVPLWINALFYNLQRLLLISYDDYMLVPIQFWWFQSFTKILFIGFSLAAWQIAEGVANTIPLDSSVVDNLLSDLNVAALVSSPPCSWTDNEYSNAITNLQKCKYKLPRDEICRIFICSFIWHNVKDLLTNVLFIHFGNCLNWKISID